MSIMGIGEVASLVTTVVERIWPDATESEKAKVQIAVMATQNEFQSNIAQMKINEVQAASPSMFVAGPRPAVMWVCVLGMIYTIFQPVFFWFCTLKGYPPLPTLDSESMMTMLGALLGLGGLRSFEKTKGVETKIVGKKK
jgi:hypothetical protein